MKTRIIKFYNEEQADKFSDFLDRKKISCSKEYFEDKPSDVIFELDINEDISDFPFLKVEELIEILNSDTFVEKKTKDYGHIKIIELVDYGNGFIIPTDINSTYAYKPIQQAIETVSNKTKFKKRINESISMLAKKSDRDNFRNGTWDFENKRLISQDKLYAMQWRVRHNPELQESYENQQTTRGNVEIERYTD